MSFSHRDARPVTSQLLEAADDQMLTWRQLAEAALRYMSESEVAHMAQVEGFSELLNSDDE